MKLENIIKKKESDVMIHFLRTKNNKNIVETEVYGVIEDLKISSNIYAEGYGRA